jgi:hypothetical protein
MQRRKEINSKKKKVKGGKNRKELTINSVGDLQKPIRRLSVEKSSEQRHVMALFLP